MKKLLSILLILFLVINSCGYIIVFQQMQLEAKREIKDRILKGIGLQDAVHFCFNQAEYAGLNFSEEDEFELNGKMYDIIKSDFKNGKYNIYCFNDEKEETIIKNLQKDTDGHKAKTPSQNTLRIISGIISTALVKSTYTIKRPIYLTNIIKYTQETFKSFCTKIPSPPPKYYTTIS